MQKIIVFTDIHILPEGETIIGLEPGERFARGLDHAVKHHPDAARIVITGDLAHTGAPVEYARLRGLLAGCPLPVSLMLGNHDRRAPFLAEFPDTPVTDRGHVQDVIDLGDTRLILLDTLDEEAGDTHSGLVCADRLRWTEEALAGAGGRRVLLFTHHPPFPTGFKGMDRIGLRNRADLIALMRRYGNVQQIVSGHIHRTIQGSAGGIPAAIFKSPCHQMPMVLGEQDPHLSVDEPGAYGLLLLDRGGIVVHTEDFTLPGQPGRLYD